MACKKQEGVNMVLVTLISILVSIASATEFVVGDDEGWTVRVDYNAWANGKVFRVGDTLVFNYKAPDHNVISVNGSNFDSCLARGGSKPLITGHDVITLTSPGMKWYICGRSNSDHCTAGMKLAITVNSLESDSPDLIAPEASPPNVPALSSSRITSKFQFENLIAMIVAVTMVSVF